MSKFNYRFESIKKIKDSLEKKAAKELAEIDAFIERQRQEYNQVVERGNNTKRDISHEKLSSFELKFIKGYEEDLKQQLLLIKLKINQLELKKDEKMIELVQKSKENKMFGTLKENHLEIFQLNENKIEMDSINEMATQKYIRGNR
ncbi:MAG: hypothetical protein AUK34_08545 [Ignavibacteria bacterium CG2_30_36_16]|nr:hypothetical protein [Ignavibacteria bacterium]OIP58740.1 MAG: hypothetical protein AUK34_08545 [Ignavibacteria bacterium CG2_30_36_16]